MTLRPDLALIARHVAPRARVLDVGCGDGELMAALREHVQADVRGLEIEPTNVAAAVARGLPVVQGDANDDLGYYPDHSFDYAILSQTLQTTHRPDRIVAELLRIGQQVFVSFPNFAHWRGRLSLLLGGRMPVTRLLPERWYATPNIHHLTIDDFRALVKKRGWAIEGQWFLNGGRETGPVNANLMAEHAVFLLRNGGRDAAVEDSSE